MIILGIDPGTRITGFGVIRVHGTNCSRLHSGAIRTDASMPMAEKLKTIFLQLSEIIDEYKPDVCSIETAFYGKNIQSTLKIGHVRGIAMLAVSLKNIEMVEYSPREVKRAVTGSGAAAKEQVNYMVKVLVRHEGRFRSNDEADGLALALCHAAKLKQPKHTSGAGTWEQFINANPDRVKS